MTACDAGPYFRSVGAKRTRELSDAERGERREAADLAGSHPEPRGS